MLAFELKGWELVVADVSDDAACARCGRGSRTVTPLAHGRFTLDLPPDAEPERLMASCAPAARTLVSLNPVRETLEDYFVQQVRAAKPRGRA